MKVGDYVRTKKGIAKIIDRINDPTNYYDKFWVCDRYLELNDDTEYIHEQDIIGEPKGKIIELIEVGDYVNGCKIIELTTNIDGKVLYLETDITEFDNVYACGHINIYENDIRTIVTKEQFSCMEYKIGE